MVHMRLPIGTEDKSSRYLQNIEFPCECWNTVVWYYNLYTSLCFLLDFRWPVEGCDSRWLCQSSHTSQ